MLVRALAALLFLLLGTQPALSEDRSFMAGYVGSLPPDPRERARTYFGRKAVQDLIVALELGPVARTDAEHMLTGSGATVDDLVRVHVVAVDGDLLRLAFAFFSARDMALVHAAVAKHAPSLVNAYRDDRRFGAIFARYDATAVEEKKLAFVVLVGIALNWDALDLLDAEHLRSPLLVSGPGWQYSFWAAEATPGFSYKGYYWGSTTLPVAADPLSSGPADFAFSSFGDPYSDPRMNFPDLFSLSASQMTPAVRAAAADVGLHDADVDGAQFHDALGLGPARELAAILFALRVRPMTERDLGPRADVSGALHAELALLAASGYVRVAGDGRWYLTAPVLDREDAPMLREAVAESRSILHAWFATHYGAMRDELRDLGAVRQGVPYEALYAQIWHELFGFASRELVAQGVVANPYDAANPSQGSLPLLWRTVIYHHDWR